MPDATENAELMAGFRRLRPAVHEWLARDLNGPPLDYTRAYADLMFAYAFARLGAADDAHAMVRAATDVLSTSANEAHGWLRRMFRYRIDEALEGKPNSGMFPEDVLPPKPDPTHFLRQNLQLELRAVEVAHSISRILDPFGVVDPYAQWTKNQDQMLRRVDDLRQLRDPNHIAASARTILNDAAALDPLKRAEVWRYVLPCAALAGRAFVGQLLMEVPDIVNQAVGTSPSREYNLLFSCRVVTEAIQQAATMPDGEFFPPLLDAAVGVIRNGPTADVRTQYVADITWAVLRWFRQLRAFDEASDFLHATREWQPDASAWGSGSGRLQEKEEFAVFAVAAEAAMRRFVGHADAERILRAVVDVTTGDRLSPKGTARGFVGIASALALWPSTEAFDRLTDLLARVPRMNNAFTTAQWYSRLHIQMAESIVLAFPAVRGM